MKILGGISSYPPSLPMCGFITKLLKIYLNWLYIFNLQSVTEGYNGTVFAYGQTGCGKSFTMQGITHPACQKGIIPRAFEHIFEAISTTENTKFLVHASYLEIYNEEIRDLLGKETKKKLELKEHPDQGVYVAGVKFLIFCFYLLIYFFLHFL